MNVPRELIDMIYHSLVKVLLLNLNNGVYSFGTKKALN